MPLTAPDRKWMQDSGVFQDYVKLRDDLKTLNIPPHEAINDALFRVSKGLKGSPYSASTQPSHPPDLPELPESPPRLDAKFGEVSDDSSYTAIQWVGQHMWVEGVSESDAPNSTAYGLLMRCQESPSFRDEFYSKMWIKTIPNQKSLEAQQRYRDNGHSLIELNSEIRRVLLKQRAAGDLPVDEPRVTAPIATLELDPDTDTGMTPF